MVGSMRVIVVLVAALSVGAPPISWSAIDTSSATSAQLSMAAPSASGSQLIRTFAKVDKAFGAGLAIVADAQPLFTPEYSIDGHALGCDESPNLDLHSPPLAARPPPAA